MDIIIPVFLLLLFGAALIMVLRIVWQRRQAQRHKRVKAARAAVLLVRNDQLLVMQQRRKGRVQARLEIPKGKIARGESSLDGAYRECFEESGLRPAELHFLASVRARGRKQRKKETWDVFWGMVPEDVALPYTHRVSGHGRDNGCQYHVRLVPLNDATLQPPLDDAVAALRNKQKEHVKQSANDDARLLV